MDKLVKSAAKPTIAWPTSTRAYPVVVKAAMAKLAGITVCLPAVLKRIGTMLAAPKPISANPVKEKKL